MTSVIADVDAVLNRFYRIMFFGAGIQGSLIACTDESCSRQLWFRKLEGNQRALAFLNLSDDVWKGDVCIAWSDIEWDQDWTAEVFPWHTQALFLHS